MMGVSFNLIGFCVADECFLFILNKNLVLIIYAFYLICYSLCLFVLGLTVCMYVCMCVGTFQFDLVNTFSFLLFVSTVLKARRHWN